MNILSFFFNNIKWMELIIKIQFLLFVKSKLLNINKIIVNKFNSTQLNSFRIKFNNYFIFNNIFK